MPSVQAKTITDKVSHGDDLMSAARTLDIAPVRKRHAAFASAHRAYVEAQNAVDRALEALHAQQEKVGELDVDQDAKINVLAGALPADGLPRMQPFKPFGVIAPSRLCDLGDVAEAKICVALVARVRKRKGVGPASKRAAGELDRASRAVIAAARPIEGLAKAHRDAIARRDALGQRWSNAFAALKRAARSAEDDGHAGLYAALFVRDARPAKKPNKKGGGGGGGAT